MPENQCAGCLAWGQAQRPFTRGLCQACYMFLRDYQDDVAACGGCGCLQPLRKGYCRLCWNQARAEARAAGGDATAVRFLDRVGGHHQLFLADLLNSRGARTTPGHLSGRGRQAAQTAATASGPPAQPVGTAAAARPAATRLHPH